MNQILHITSQNIHLRKHRGKIICEYNDQDTKKEMPLEDIRGVVLVSNRFTLSSVLVSALLERGAFIFHCNSKFVPVGVTMPMDRVINKDAIVRQVKTTSSLHKQLSQKILKQKVINQALVLKMLGENNTYILDQSKKQPINESACARYYWQRYFPACGSSEASRHYSHDHIINKMLNYSYAILRSLCHRSVVAHGLSPLFGLNHKMRYQSHAFVYDVMEPLRPFCDVMVHAFLRVHKNQDLEEDELFKKFVEFSQYMLSDMTVLTKQEEKYKLVDAVDVYLVSIAKVFEVGYSKPLWIPTIKNLEIKKDRLTWDG